MNRVIEEAFNSKKDNEDLLEAFINELDIVTKEEPDQFLPEPPDVIYVDIDNKDDSIPIPNNTPRVIFNGIKDESIVPLLPELEAEPIHMPLLYVFTQRGPDMGVSKTSVDEKEPLSKLKQNRLREKEQKEKRRMKKKLDNTRRLQSDHKKMENVKKQKKEKGFDVKNAKWAEAKETAMDVWNLISTYEEMTVMAILAINDPTVIIDQEGSDMVHQRVKLITADAANLKARWTEICSGMEGLEGKVKLEEFPTFYLIYEELLNLHQDANNVLVDSSAELTDMVNLIMDKKIESTQTTDITETGVEISNE